MLNRKASLTQTEFVDYHRGVHASLFMWITVVKETVRRYVQQHAIDATLPGMPPAKYDDITELWFDDVDALDRCFSDPVYMEKVRPDEESFLDLHACDFIVSTKNTVT